MIESGETVCFICCGRMGYKGNAGAFCVLSMMVSRTKVVFGDFSTEWFGQENGLKQGCVLSPTLFSVLLNDLVNMLDGVGIGIDVGKQLINCLLFADDIALIAETEEELQRLLDVASAFVIKWNLSFNFNKSKVLVVGKEKGSIDLNNGSSDLI